MSRRRWRAARKRTLSQAPPKKCEECGEIVFGRAGLFSAHVKRCPARLKCVPRKMFPAEWLESLNIPLSAYHYLAVSGLAVARGVSTSCVIRWAVLTFLHRVLWGSDSDYALLFEELWGSRPSPSPRDSLSLAIEAHTVQRPLDLEEFQVGTAAIIEQRGWSGGVSDAVRNLSVGLTPKTHDVLAGLLFLKVYASVADAVRTAVVEYVRTHVSPHFVPSHGGFVPREVCVE